MYAVYKHTCPNGKCYIGITCQVPKYRWNNGKGYARHIFFNNAIKKYGWDNIKHEILFDELTKEQAEQKEIELIALYKSNQREYGYNIELGGSTNKMTDETRERLSLAHKGKHTSIKTEFKTGHIPANSRMVEVLKDGKIIGIFRSASETAIAFNLSVASVSSYCRGKRKRKNKNGYTFRFIEV